MLIDQGDQGLMELHVRTLFRCDRNSRLLTINEPGGGSVAPRLFLGRTKAANHFYFRADLPSFLLEQLQTLSMLEPLNEDFLSYPAHVESYVRLLETHAPVQAVRSGPAYLFDTHAEPSRPLQQLGKTNAELLLGGFEDLASELCDWQPFLAIVEDGRAVSVCRSVRITSNAHEAGVQTLGDYRGKGYGKDVVAGWACAVRALGAIPMYSTTWENAASRAVAAKLQLRLYGVDFQIS